MVLGNQTLGFVHRNIQLVRELCYTHAVHHAKVYCLGLFAWDLRHLCDHRVEVCAAIFVVAIYKFFCALEGPTSLFAKKVRVVNQDPRFLLREVNCRPLFSFFW